MTSLSTRAPASWQARTCYIAAALFTLASAGTNLIYGWQKGTDLASSLVWAAVSVAVSAIFAFSWPAILISLDRQQWSRAVMALIALLLTGTYSVSAALGSAMGGRANAAISEQANADTRAKVQAAWDAAKLDLEKLSKVNPTDEIEQLIADARNELNNLPEARSVEILEAAVATAEKCGPGAVRSVQVTRDRRTTICRASSSLTSELGRARTREQLTAKITGWNADRGTAEQRHSERREKLQAAMDKAAGDLTATKPPKIANSDAVALATYLTGLGFEITADRVNKLLVLLAVLMIECGGGLALAVGMALGDTSRHASETQKREAVPPETSRVPQSVPASVPPPTQQAFPAFQPRSVQPQPEPREPLDKRLIRLVTEHGGTLVAGQREIARMIGVSSSHAHRLLHDLSVAGVLSIVPGRSGTIVKRLVN